MNSQLEGILKKWLEKLIPFLKNLKNPQGKEVVAVHITTSSNEPVLITSNDIQDRNQVKQENVIDFWEFATILISKAMNELIFKDDLEELLVNFQKKINSITTEFCNKVLSVSKMQINVTEFLRKFINAEASPNELFYMVEDIARNIEKSINYPNVKSKIIQITKELESTLEASFHQVENTFKTEIGSEKMQKKEKNSMLPILQLNGKPCEGNRAIDIHFSTSQVITITQDGTLNFMKISDDEKLLSIFDKKYDVGAPDPKNSAIFSPDGTLYLINCRQINSLFLCSIKKKGAIINKLEDKDASFINCCIFYNNNQIILGYENGDIILCYTEEDNGPPTIYNPFKCAISTFFKLDESILIGDVYGRLGRIDIVKKKTIWEISNHQKNQINCINMMNNDFILSGSNIGVVKCINKNNLEETWQFRVDNCIYSLSRKPDWQNLLIVQTEASIYIIDEKGNKKLLFPDESLKLKNLISVCCWKKNIFILSSDGKMFIINTLIQISQIIGFFSFFKMNNKTFIGLIQILLIDLLFYHFIISSIQTEHYYDYQRIRKRNKTFTKNNQQTDSIITVHIYQFCNVFLGKFICSFHFRENRTQHQFQHVSSIFASNWQNRCDPPNNAN